MAMRIGSPRTITTTVETFDGQTFEATFRVLPDAEINDLAEQDGGKAALRAMIIGLGDIVGPDDKPLPYTEELRDQILAVQADALALQRAYNKAVIEAALGN